MKQRTKVIIALIITFISGKSLGQDSLITEMAKRHLTTFTKDSNGFRGQGWERILERARASNFVLVGEDHCTNEVPYFHLALISRIKFDNFFCEIDPYLADILQTNIRTLSESDLEKYTAEYNDSFSFFSLKPEFNLLKQLVQSKTNIYGLDQIFILSIRSICYDLQQRTRNTKAKKIYASIADSSKMYYDNAVKSHIMTFYMFTPDFKKQLADLSQLNVSKHEKDIIEALKLTVKIYEEQNHPLRIQLLKNQLMKIHSVWEGKKNLFKYGGIHLPKGESLMRIYDIGNLVSNIADSKFESSFHILILEKSGIQGAPFKGLPDQKVDVNEYSLRPLAPFFAAVTGEEWHCFNLTPLREVLEDDKLVVKDVTLQRIIKGYDILVIIPTVTPARFIEVEGIKMQ